MNRKLTVIERGRGLHRSRLSGWWPVWALLCGPLLSCGAAPGGESQLAKIAAAPGEPAAVTVAPAPRPEPTYEVKSLARSQLHVVTVPSTSEARVRIKVVPDLALLADIAAEAGAIAAINGGFFDPNNGLTTSHVIVAGGPVADPRQNPRLVENPSLTPYLPAILNRSEFRIYNCGGMVSYDIARRQAAVPQGCVLDSAIGAGPQLLPAFTGYEEGFLADNGAGERIRDALGSQQLNARSAIGLRADGTVILAMASQLPDREGSTGLTLEEMAMVMVQLGTIAALNLDGGSSSGLVFQGEARYGRLGAEGQPIVRPIKSVLLVY